MTSFRLMLLAGAVALAPSLGSAQSASTLGAGSASGNSGTIAGGGSAAAGGTSASTIGAGGVSGDSKSLGSGGSAAAVDGKATSSTKLNNNPNNMQGMSKARAQDGGTWSRSMTKTKIKKDGTLSTRTKSMAHEPGGPPAKSMTRQSVQTGQ